MGPPILLNKQRKVELIRAYPLQFSSWYQRWKFRNDKRARLHEFFPGWLLWQEMLWLYQLDECMVTVTPPGLLMVARSHQWHLSRKTVCRPCSRHNTWKYGACGKPNWNKSFQLHPILRHFWISLKPCYHVDIEKPMLILKTSGRCNRIHKSRIHFFPSPNIAEAGGLSSSGEIC